MSTIKEFTPGKLKSWIESYSQGVSGDAGQVLSMGSDNLPYYDADYNDLINIPVLNYLPLAGGTLTGDLQGVNIYGGTSGAIATGVGSGSVGMTVNDGQGNSNITFNHIDGVVDQAGNAARIVVNTDATTGCKISFETLSNAATGGVTTIERLGITDTAITSTVDITAPTFLGALSGNVTGDVTGDLSGGVTGTLNGYGTSTGTTVNTIAVRQANGYLYAVYFNATGTFSNSGANSGMGTFTGTNGTDTFGRSYSATGAAALLQTVGFPALTQNIVVSGSTRDKGMCGTYSSTLTQNIWAMGAAYKVAANGTSFGNLYGASYMHSNHTGYPAYAGGHQFVWCENGTARVALGTNIWASGNITAYSDIRVKEDIQVIPDALDKIGAIRGVTYERTDNEVPRQTGVIAQEVLAVLPEAVSGSEDDHYSVAYGNLVGLLIEGIKELRIEVENLKENQ